MPMNVLIIPSWYPTADFPITGIFIKEQVSALAQHFPQSNFAVSLWGSHDRSLWWDKANLWRVSSKLEGLRKKSCSKQLSTNAYEYFTPAFTWTRKWRNGNLSQIIKANRENLVAFENKFGKIDVIHAHVSHPAGVIAMRLSAEFDVPYIITEHMGPFPFSSLQDGRGEPIPPLKEALKKASRVISVSGDLAQKIKPYARSKPLVIPNLIEEEHFTGRIRKPGNTITFVGRMVKEKGISELLQVWPRISEKYPDWQLKLIGDGPLTRQLEHPSIQWAGELTKPEISEHLGTSAFLILPSHFDNNPLVIIEAMASGLPVLATAVGGIPEMVTSRTGLLTSPNDEEALRLATEKMMNNYHSFDEKHIRKTFLEKYSSKMICQQIMAVYENVHSHNT